MSKSRKICAYKECNTSDSNSTNETYFSFPSDPARCEIWKELCKTELAVPKYLCSKHFDRKKYLSENPRRSVLLNTAVPYPYESLEQQQTFSNDSVVVELQCSSDTFEDQSTNIVKDDFIEINEENFQLHEKPTITYVEENIEKSIKIEPYKRKSNNTLITIPVKIKKVQNVESFHQDLIVSKNNGNFKEKFKLHKIKVNSKDDDDKINEPNSEITTFIFKGEEYVQMPKSLYLNEKSILEKKVQHYENIVHGIKNFLEKESDFKG